MADDDIFARIKELVDEEHRLAGDPESPEERHERRRYLEEQLDQCWDLLRRRQAIREAGLDEGSVEPRPVSQVEHYLQ